MRLSSLAVLMIITTVLLSACAQDEVASLEDHSNQFFTKGGMAQLAAAGEPAQTYVAPQMTVASVTNDSVASSDLPPPSAGAAAAPAHPVTAAAPAAHPMTTAAVTAGWQWPLAGRVIEAYGKQGEGVANEGITIAAKKGTPIHAAAGGEVVFVGSQLKDYGNMVILRHPGGEMSAYSHAQEIIVSKGDKVKPGDVLGFVGQSGNAEQPELHFAVRENNRPIDPLTKLPAQVASN